MKEIVKKLFIKFKSSESGQSLIEILIALTVGAILIGTASTAVVVILRSSTTSQAQQSATVFAQEYTSKARSFADSNWSNIYNLKKGSSTKYMFESSSTETIAVEGIDGVIDNNIRRGMIGHWKLDEATSTTAYDSSDNNNDGTLENDVSQATSSCKMGNCLNYDGSDDKVSISHDSSLSPSDEVTVVAWVNQTGDAAANQFQRITDKGGAITYWVDHTDGGVCVRLTATEGGGASQTCFSTNITQNEWHHIGFTYSSSEDSTKLYVDGQLFASSSYYSGTMSGNTSDLVIGNWTSDDLRPWNGFIDDVRIYNRALSDESIENLYNSTVFERFFYAEDVCRTSDSNYDLAGTTPCDGGEVKDPSTQKISIVVEWGDDGQFTLEDYITRWRNDAFHQSDWSGGSGQEGPFSGSADVYSSSTDISTSTGSIKIEGI